MNNRPKELSQIQDAERMYCSERLSARIIADKINCNIKTIYKWRDKYNWGKNGILFTDEETNTILQDICLIKENDLRFSLTQKFTQNRYRYYTQTDVITILSDICLIKEDSLRIRLVERIKANQPKQ